jgi:hypothetical protein
MYAIIRTERLTSLHQACAHNLRTKYSKNVDKTKTPLNEIIVDNLQLSERAAIGADAGTYDERILKYYKEKNVKVKKNSVLAMEFMLTASPEFFQNASKQEFNSWKKAQLNFMKKEFGDQVQFAVLHLDEKSPHFHFFISVEETKIQKYKNRYGAGEKLVSSLNADRYNPEFLVKLQDRYAQANKKFNLTRGLRNSKAVHRELKDFYTEVKKFLEQDDYYTDVVDNLIKKIPSVMGVCKVKDVSEFFKPVINKLMRQSKSTRIVLKDLPQKIKYANDLLEQYTQLNNDIKETRDYYKEAINAKIADDKKIQELQKEVERLKQFEPVVNEEVVYKPTKKTGVKYGS